MFSYDKSQLDVKLETFLPQEFFVHAITDKVKRIDFQHMHVYQS